jgi:hypothetical protein
MKTVPRLLSTCALVASLSGCAGLVMTYHDVAATVSRHWSAEKAWRVRKWMYADIPCRGSFKTGFKAGYRFACGGCECNQPPALRHYWRIGCLTESERANAQAWTDGFNHGTLAAQHDQGCGAGPEGGPSEPGPFETPGMQPYGGMPEGGYFMPPQMPNGQMPNGAMPNGMENYPPSPNMAPSPGYQMPMPYGPAYPPQTAPPAPWGGGEMAPPPAPGMEVTPPSSYMPPAPGGPQSFFPGAAPPPAPAASMPGVTLSEGAPGFGPLTAIPLQPAPPAEPGPAPFSPAEAIRPIQQATQAADWQLPMRD